MARVLGLGQLSLALHFLRWPLLEGLRFVTVSLLYLFCFALPLGTQAQKRRYTPGNQVPTHGGAAARAIPVLSLSCMRLWLP